MRNETIVPALTFHRVMGAFFREVVHPAYHWLKRDGINQAIAELERNEKLSIEELRELQGDKLNALLAFAGRNVPYYRSHFASLGIDATTRVSADDFRRIAPLTKDIIRGHGDALVSEDLKGNALLSNSTSGSTGEALRFYVDRRATPYRMAATLRSDFWTGWRLGDRRVFLWGAPIDQRRAAGLRGRLHSLATGGRFLSSFDLSVAAMDKYIEIILDFKPVFMLAYPGPLEQFAAHCAARDVRFPSLIGIVCSAETLWPHQREIIEDALGVRVFNRYGTREVSQIASECEYGDGLHISIDRHVLEVVDDAGNPCPPGEEGRILITDLDNYGMPLIRYEIGDRGVLAEERPCACGRAMPRLERVAGRTLDIVRTPDGRKVGGTFWTLLLRSRRGLRQFQVVQEQLDSVVVRFVRDAEFDETALAYFTDKIREQCGHDFGVVFEETDSIDLSASGKQRLIVSKLGDARTADARIDA